MREIESTSYFKNIQAARAIAALLVLTFHVYAVEGKYFGHHLVPGVLGLFGTCGVDLFFVISGFVMVTTTAARDKVGARYAADFLWRRATRIYPVYWFYSLIVLAVMLLMPQWVNASTGHHADVLRSFLLLPAGTLPLLLQGWTLIYEMFFYVVFAVILACVAKRHLTAALLTWAAVTGGLAYWLGSGHAAGPAVRIVGDPLVLEFIAGCFCARLWPVVRKPWPLVLLVSGIMGFAVAFAVGARVGQATVLQWRAVFFGAPGFLVILGAASLEGYMMVRAPRALCGLGDASYSLYLSHVLVISAVGRFYERFALAKLGPAVGTILCISFAIVVGHLSYRFIERPLNDALKRTLTPTKTVSAA